VRPFPRVEKQLEAKAACPRCGKPNNVAAKTCTGCGHPIDPRLDFVFLPANPFLEVLSGARPDHRIMFRDGEICVFENLFPTADCHLLAIPVSCVPDITHLSAADIPLVERLHREGVRALRSICDADEDDIFAGFNVPVSVPHLHMHVAARPTREEGFRSSRFYPYRDVVRDLEAYGRVVLHEKEGGDL
jgi:diadenosine tetraphosphate (Ap4A) HIT family hydrolase/ribosomal protein L40E